MNRTAGIYLFLGVAAFAQSPVLRPGIRVEMAVTTSAAPMRQADEAGSRVVAVTSSGAVYWDAAQVTPAILANELRNARGAGVYVKADARAPYASVVAIFATMRTAGAKGVTLLTSQPDPTEGRYATPKGIEVTFGAPADPREKAVVIDAAGPISFGEVVRVLDASRSSGAKVFFK